MIRDRRSQSLVRRLMSHPTGRVSKYANSRSCRRSKPSLRMSCAIRLEMFPARSMKNQTQEHRARVSPR